MQANIKMTEATPEVRSDKNKPREDRQNHRYLRIIEKLHILAAMLKISKSMIYSSKP